MVIPPDQETLASGSKDKMVRLWGSSGLREVSGQGELDAEARSGGGRRRVSVNIDDKQVAYSG